MMTIPFQKQLAFFCFILVSLLFSNSSVVFSSSDICLLRSLSVETQSCTVFTAVCGDLVLFGNNEDETGHRLYTKIWFETSLETDKFGCVYLGFDNNPPGAQDVDGLAIGGMNDQGLCFDANGVGLTFINYEPSKGSPKSGIECWREALSECNSVENVIQWYKSHNMGGWWGNQLHWADASGDAVIISALSTGLAFTRINASAEAYYLISTNFNPANHSDGYYPCQRYIKAKNYLDYFLPRKMLTIDNAKRVLESVYFRNTTQYVGTVYSNIFDLKTQTIYLWIHGNFKTVFTLDLSRELVKGDHEYNLTLLGQGYYNFDYRTTEPLHTSSFMHIQLFLLLNCSLISVIRKKKERKFIN